MDLDMKIKNLQHCEFWKLHLNAFGVNSPPVSTRHSALGGQESLESVKRSRKKLAKNHLSNNIHSTLMSYKALNNF